MAVEFFETKEPVDKQIENGEKFTYLCSVCGDIATGYHYNVLCCEGCKGFFRRSILRNASYKCKYGGNCEMDLWMRRKCPSCRMRICLDKGMEKKFLLSFDQCNARHRRNLRCPSKSGEKSPVRCPQKTFRNVIPVSELTMDAVLDMMNPAYKSLIKALMSLQEQYEFPDPKDSDKVYNIDPQILATLSPDQIMLKIMTDMTVLVMNLVIEFAIHLPGFTTLCDEDQGSLMRQSSVEVLVLRTSRCYAVETDTVIFAGGNAVKREQMRVAGLNGYVDDLYNFCRMMAGLQPDDAEYAMLTAICIISERPNLTKTAEVEELQSKYVMALRSYVHLRHGGRSCKLAKLLMKLVDLRTLSHNYNEVLFNLKLHVGSLPAILEQYLVNGSSLQQSCQ